MGLRKDLLRRRERGKERKKIVGQTLKAAITEGDILPPTTKVCVTIGRGTEVAPNTLSAPATIDANLSLSTLVTSRPPE